MDRIFQIRNEADRIEESATLSATQHFIAAKYWRNTHFTMGVVATVGAAVASAIIYSDDYLWIANGISIVVAILAGLMTFLRPDENATAHHKKGTQYKKLRDDARILKNIGTVGRPPDEELAKQIRALNDRSYSIANDGPPTPSGRIYKLAQKAIANGETAYRIDQVRTGS